MAKLNVHIEGTRRTLTALGMAGGFGAVYSVSGVPTEIAKVFNKPAPQKGPVDGVSADLAEKLRHMIANPPRSVGPDDLAWPLRLVESRDGQIVGYTMRRMPGQELAKYTLQNRDLWLYKPSYREVVTFLAEVARIVATLHEEGYVVGDLSPKNIFLEHKPRKGAIHFIDTDSFQLRIGGKGYPTGGVSPDYCPPECTGEKIAKGMREPSHDNFALAILIFYFLAGRHPTDGERERGDPRSIEESLAKGVFPAIPWDDDTDPNDPSRIPWTSLPLKLRDLFRDTFIDGFKRPEVRPSAVMWKEALEAEIPAMRKCLLGHYRFAEATACPWCSFKFPESKRHQPAKNGAPRLYSLSDLVNWFRYSFAGGGAGQSKPVYLQATVTLGLAAYFLGPYLLGQSAPSPARSSSRPPARVLQPRTIALSSEERDPGAPGSLSLEALKASPAPPASTPIATPAAQPRASSGAILEADVRRLWREQRLAEILKLKDHLLAAKKNACPTCLAYLAAAEFAQGSESVAGTYAASAIAASCPPIPVGDFGTDFLRMWESLGGKIAF